MNFKLHDIESAPEAVRPDLQAAKARFGAIPNLYRGLAANPATLKIYLAFNEMLPEHGLLSPMEQQVVYLTVSAENGCTYCVGAHSVLAGMADMPAQTLAELRAQGPLSDSRLRQLQSFTLSVMAHRGEVPAQDLVDFATAGFNQGHVLEVLTILAHKILSNYFNHIAHTPLDEMFQAQAWTPNTDNNE